MDDRRFGLVLRERRRQLRWRRRDVALKAHARQQEASDVERGRLAEKRVSVVRRIAAVLAVGAPFEPRHRGGEAARDRREGGGNRPQ
jgi:transcriptional regulator with XRE-family HTH domain